MILAKEYLSLTGPVRLNGELVVSGSKNASLPILAASILTNKTKLYNVPKLTDINVLLSLLTSLNAKITLSADGGLLIDNSELNSDIALPYDLCNKMRASFLLLGPLLARYGKAKIALPGGCAIGSRPVDLHIKILEALGAEIHLDCGHVIASSRNGLVGTEFSFDFVSVGATENAIMAAVLAKGVTVLKNVAKEPEIIALADALINAGAKIQGHGSDTIVIEGVDSLNDINYKIIPDRIEAGTFLIAAVATRGDILLQDVNIDHIDSLLSVLRNIGADITLGDNSIRLKMDIRPAPFEIVTDAYPGFPTDLQAQMMALACICDGTSVIQEKIFENRMMHVPELVHMGGDIKLMMSSAVIKGKENLRGVSVTASDLRASAALIIAAMVAKGVTKINELQHLERGYVLIDERLRNLGAIVDRLQALPV